MTEQCLILKSAGFLVQKNVTDEKKEKKNVSGKSLIEKVRNERKYKLKVKWDTKVRNYNLINE